MKAITKKMYRVFDELHTTMEGANEVLKGWEHKEKITEVFAVGYENDLSESVIYDIQGIYLAKTLEEAQEEEREMNE